MTNAYTEAQRAILSIILNNGSAAFDVAQRYLEERHFTELRYKMMWRCIRWLWENDHEITEITTENSMMVTRDTTGQAAFDLLDPRNGKHRDELLAIKEYRGNENISHLQSYIDIILDKFKVEKYFDMAQNIIKLAKDGKTTTGQLQAVVGKYSEFFTEKDRKMPRSLVDICDTIIQKNLASDDGDQSIINCDIPMLDSLIWLTPGNQTIIAGDTSHGKSSLALQIAWNIAKQRKKVVDRDTGRPVLDDNGYEIWQHRTVIFYALEMNETELTAKLFCIDNNITMKAFKDMSPKERASKVETFQKKIKQVAPNLKIDCESTSLREIISKSNMVYSASGNIDVIVVDYLQLVEDAKESDFRREDTVYRTISRTLKKMSKKLDCHVIALSQLNNPPTDKTGAVNHRPTLQRLFGSSALKQDATHVILIYREWAAGIKKTIINNESHSSLYVNRLLLAKHRYGSNQVEVVCGFVPYLSYFLPIKVIRDNNLLDSFDDTIVFPKIKEFTEQI